MAIIDRRQDPRGKNVGNRKRFKDRAYEQIRRRVRSATKKRGIQERGGENIDIKNDESLREPRFRPSGKSGTWRRVLPGNDKYHAGDIMPKPESGEGSGADAGTTDEGEDSFAFYLSGEEIAEIILEDCELPFLRNTEARSIERTRLQRAGFSTTGSPERLSYERTMRNSMARRIALHRPREHVVAALREELEKLKAGEIDPPDGQTPEERIEELEGQLRAALERRRVVPFIDPLDVRYNAVEPVPQPITQAVIFYLMDVSASMDEEMKYLAKLFFQLLNLFIQNRYYHVEVVFIRHAAGAREVDEDTFFYGKETGGTIVSSALEEMLSIIDDRYPPSAWNIYVAQASDGDNWSSDNKRVYELMQSVLRISQFFTYVEVGERHATNVSPLWEVYAMLTESERLVMRQLSDRGDIAPVFRDIFSRERATNALSHHQEVS